MRTKTIGRDLPDRGYAEITIQIGGPIDEIPNYTWSAN